MLFAKVCEINFHTFLYVKHKSCPVSLYDCLPLQSLHLSLTLSLFYYSESKSKIMPGTSDLPEEDSCSLKDYESIFLRSDKIRFLTD